jgi:hypothetical protein
MDAVEKKNISPLPGKEPLPFSPYPVVILARIASLNKRSVDEIRFTEINCDLLFWSSKRTDVFSEASELPLLRFVTR